MITNMFEVVLLLWLCANVHGYDRAKLAITPRGMQRHSIAMELGKWYYQLSLVPCSWAGASKFTDYTNTMLENTEKGYLTATESWRSDGTCVKVNSRVTPDSDSCTRTIRDPIGDVTSGKDVVVATDGGKSFIIYWGCTKTGTSGGCMDPWVDVATRHKRPSSGTLRIVEAILKEIWDLSISEMVAVTHTNEC